MPPKGILPYSYFNARVLAKALEEIGYRPFQVVDIWGLMGAHTAGDRQTFNIEGNSIIIPQQPASLQWGNYNQNLHFEISFNSEGQDEDDWISFITTPNPNLPFMTKVEHLVFYKFTVRNTQDIAISGTNHVRVYVLQDPTFIVQLNKLVKDAVQ